MEINYNFNRLVSGVNVELGVFKNGLEMNECWIWKIGPSSLVKELHLMYDLTVYFNRLPFLVRPP